MISKTLMKQTIKSNWVLWAILTGIQAFFLVSMVLGGGATMNVGMVAGTYYKMIPGLISAVYVIITANKLVASQVDKGTMAYILSTPVKRSKVALTQATFLMGSIFAMYLISSLAHIVAHILANESITGAQVGAIVVVNLGLLLLNAALSGICYLVSCHFNLSKNAVALGGGLVGGFHLMSLVGSMVSSFSWLKNITLVTLFDVNSILTRFNMTNMFVTATDDTAFIWKFVILGVIAIAAYVLGAWRFSKRDLPL